MPTKPGGSVRWCKAKFSSPHGNTPGHPADGPIDGAAAIRLDRSPDLGLAGFLTSWSFLGHDIHWSFSVDGTKWHWLATFQKVSMQHLNNPGVEI